jgi:hypothetical protein
VGLHKRDYTLFGLESRRRPNKPWFTGLLANAIPSRGP